MTTVHAAGFDRWLTLAGLVLLLLMSGVSAQAAVQAHVSQNPVYVGDTVTLTLSADGGGGGQPDLSPLRNDFDVVGTGTSSQMSMINGRTSSRTQWRIELLPRRSGDLSIPALQVGNERSQAITLKVTDTPPAGDAKAAAAGQHVIVEASVDAAVDAPYVQQQVPYQVRLYFDEAVRDGSLSDPQVADAVVERIGDEARYTATRNGRQYRVIERRYAVFPQKSGELEIPPVRFEGRVADSGNGRGTNARGNGLMQRFLQGSPFANDPFFQGGVFGDRGRAVRTFGPTTKVTVRPRAGTQASWLPATSVRVHDSWSGAAPQLKVGEPVSRTVTLEAEGLTGAQIPALDLPTPDGMRVYREPVENATHNDGKRLVGISRQTLTYIPDTAGSVGIPALEVEWWDTQKDAAAVASSPAWRLDVAPGSGGTPTRAAQNAAATSPAQLQRTPDTEPTDREAATATVEQGWPSWVMVVLAMLALALLVPLVRFGLRRRSRHAVQAMDVGTAQRRQVAATAAPPHRTSSAVADSAALLSELGAACRERDATLAARTLLALARAQWGDGAPRNLGDLADRLDVGADAVRALDRHLYAADDSPWPAHELWRVLQNGLPVDTAADDARRADELPPLYPHHA